MICGERHAALAEPCCDALWIPPRRSGVGGFVICDGAGSTAAVAQAAASGTRAGGQALRLLHRRIALGPSPRRADHTLLVCLWDRQLLLVARVGDSSLLLRRNGRW